jgi:putative spermidine/putrescine transport system substrate-binding protein
MNQFSATRRRVIGTLGAAVASAPFAARAAMPMPSSPVRINIVDVAGNLQLTQTGFEQYAKANGKYVSNITFSQAPAPELPGKIKAQQAAGAVDIDIVLTGNDALAAGIEMGIWEHLYPTDAANMPKVPDVLNPLAKRLYGAAQGQGAIVACCPGGPIFEYMPDAVTKVPTTAAELLDWARANKNQFIYARPANSGPGRALMMGLPYILGDKDPKDPKDGWDKTWAYLAELSKYIQYYPGSTGITLKELGDGTRSMIASHVGWDINPRVLGVVPKEANIFALKGFHWIGDSHFMCVPSGLPAGTLAVVLDIINYMYQMPQQALTYDKGYFYPGPVVEGVTLAMAPKASQDAINEYGRKVYDTLIPDNPLEQPLDPGPMVYAFKRWDEQVGAHVGGK